MLGVFMLLMIVVPVSVILLIIWLINRHTAWLKIIGGLWLLVFLLVASVQIIRWVTTPKNLKKSDYYGEYIIDRSFYPGKQADWQYNHYRFEVLENDSLLFHITDGKRIVRTLRGTISTDPAYLSQRLTIHADTPTHHIINSNPTTHRSPWSFYLVFYSPKFNNVFFRKGEWEPIN